MALFVRICVDLHNRCTEAGKPVASFEVQISPTITAHLIFGVNVF